MSLAEVETFWTLAHNLAHWEFEGFLMFLENVVLGIIAVPLFKKWLKAHDRKHHKDDCNHDQGSLF